MVNHAYRIKLLEEDLKKKEREKARLQKRVRELESLSRRKDISHKKEIERMNDANKLLRDILRKNGLLYE